MTTRNGTIAINRSILRQMFHLNRMYQSRAELAAQLGKQFDGDRDIYKQAGYPSEISFEKYNGKYTRQDIAGRIVDAPALATWQKPPTLKDGDLGETLFIQTWNRLVNFNRTVSSIEDQKSIWHYLMRIDKMSGIGKFGVLLVGINDGWELNQPLARAVELKEQPAKFLYLSPYDEGNAEVNEVSKDPTTNRFNLPKTYSITTGADLVGSGVEVGTIDTPVHWSRVIHVAEGLRNNEIFGTPRLEGVYNLLEDLLKVTAATGESAWQLMVKGLILSTKEGYELPEDDDEFDQEIEDYMHGLARNLQLHGMDVTIEGGEIVDPSGVIKSIVSLISAETGIPQRILLGSEAGHLASDQDEQNWVARIEARQTDFAEPVILRPLISRLIYTGILPPPSSGNYQVVWPSLISMSDLEKADLHQKEAAALAASVGPDKLAIETYVREFLKWSDKQVEDMQEARRKEMMFEMSEVPFPQGFER